jgi:hypothetical protein
MIPVDAVSNAGIAGIRHGGAFELRFMNWIFTIGAPSSSTVEPVICESPDHSCMARRRR